MFDFSRAWHLPMSVLCNDFPCDRINCLDGIFQLVWLRHNLKCLSHPLYDVWEDHFRPQVGELLHHLEYTVASVNLFVAWETDSEGHLKVITSVTNWGPFSSWTLIRLSHAIPTRLHDGHKFCYVIISQVTLCSLHIAPFLGLWKSFLVDSPHKCGCEVSKKVVQDLGVPTCVSRGIVCIQSLKQRKCLKCQAKSLPFAFFYHLFVLIIKMR